MANTYDQGQSVRIYLAIPVTNTETGATVDPASLHFVCEKPDGTFIRATWTSSAGDPTGTIVHTGPTNSGAFYAVVLADVVAPGASLSRYDFRFYSDEPEAGSARGYFYVAPDALV